MRIVGQNSDVYFGEVDEEEPDWRNELEEETDPDDEELEYTPQDVIDILGFDPKEFSEPEPEPTYNESDPMSLNTTKALLIINAKKGSGIKNPKMKGWTDTARKKAALTRKAKKKVVKGKSGETKSKKSMHLSSKVAYGSVDYREATNKITKARQSMDKKIKAGLIAPEERALFSKKVVGFHKNLIRKLDKQIKSGNYPPEGMIHTKKQIQSFLDDEGYSTSVRKSKERQRKRPNSGKSPFGM